MGTDTESFFYSEVLAFSLLPRAEDREEAIKRKRVVQPAVSWDVSARPPAAP
jgi:hypothetical protein